MTAIIIIIIVMLLQFVSYMYYNVPAFMMYHQKTSIFIKYWFTGFLYLVYR